MIRGTDYASFRLRCAVGIYSAQRLFLALEAQASKAKTGPLTRAPVDKAGFIITSPINGPQQLLQGFL